MCTAVGQVSVFSVSTIPRTGFIERLAMPVLKFLEVISKIAVPVVSDPVPAVVGTIVYVISSELRPNEKRRQTRDQRPKFLSDWQALSWNIFSVMATTINGRVDKPTGALMKSIRSASL